ncbi:MAG TPA: hypothetical protein VFJ43_02060 [Bacteroidia bacterium]|nr:hypothetical protein [Bacteroidia bacterium]
MNNSEKLIETITKNGVTTIGEVSINKDGKKYRYDLVVLKYKSTSYWLACLFQKAAKDNGNEYGTQFFYKNYSFHFDRAKFKGQAHGKIRFTELIMISEDEK